MSVVDQIAEKRRANQAEQASKSLHIENIDAVGKSGQSVVEATNKLAKTEDINRLLLELQQLKEAYNLVANKKIEPPVVNINLDDKIKSLTAGITSEISKLDSGEQDGQILAELKQLNQVLVDTQDDGISDHQVLITTIKQLIAATNAIKVAPVIKVTPTPVTIETSMLDLQPLQDTLKQYLDTKQEYEPPEPGEKAIDLSEFRAQDINDGKDKQYVGFMHPNGNWYILENNIQLNTLRYLFGQTNYSETFASASTYEYQLLDEAIYALTT